MEGKWKEKKKGRENERRKGRGKKKGVSKEREEKQRPKAELYTDYRDLQWITLANGFDDVDSDLDVEPWQWRCRMKEEWWRETFKGNWEKAEREQEKEERKRKGSGKVLEQ